MVSEHPLYTEMGRTKATRCENYKSLFKVHIDDDQLKSIHVAWQAGTLLSNDHFREKLSEN